MTNQVNTWIKDTRNSEYGFFKAVVFALESFNNGDGNSLGKLLSITHGKTAKRLKTVQGDRLQYATPLANILSHALEGVEFKYDKTADFGVVFTRGDNGGASTDRIEALKVLGRTSIRCDTFKAAFPKIAKDKKKKTLEQKQKQATAWLQKFAKDNGMSVKAAKALISAL